MAHYIKFSPPYRFLHGARAKDDTIRTVECGKVESLKRRLFGSTWKIQLVFLALAGCVALFVGWAKPSAKRSHPFAEGMDFKFFAVNAKKTIRFSQINSELNGEDSPVGVYEFTLLDLNHDGQQELILELSGCGSDVLILHRMKDGLYGYIKPFRGFKSLRKDGTYEGASSAVDVGEYRVNQFLPTGIQEACVWRHESGECRWTPELGEPEVEILHFIGEKQVIQEELNAFADTLEEAEFVEWRPWPAGRSVPEDVVHWLNEAGVTWLKPEKMKSS